METRGRERLREEEGRDEGRWRDGGKERVMGGCRKEGREGKGENK